MWTTDPLFSVEETELGWEATFPRCDPRNLSLESRSLFSRPGICSCPQWRVYLCVHPLTHFLSASYVLHDRRHHTTASTSQLGWPTTLVCLGPKASPLNMGTWKLKLGRFWPHWDEWVTLNGWGMNTLPSPWGFQNLSKHSWGDGVEAAWGMQDWDLISRQNSSKWSCWFSSTAILKPPSSSLH